MILTTVQYGLVDGVATMTLNRPESRNALNRAMCEDIVAATSAAAADGDVRLVLIRGTGPVFCAGHDFADVADADLDSVRGLLATCTELMDLIQSVPQPVVARVHALATDAGCQLVATCDLAVAAESAGFAAPGGKGGWFCHPPAVPVAPEAAQAAAPAVAAPTPVHPVVPKAVFEGDA